MSSKKDMYLNDYETGRSHYRVDGRIYNINELTDKFKVDKGTVYNYFKDRDRISLKNVVIEEVENTPQLLQEYALQQGKQYIKTCEVCGITSETKNVCYSSKNDMYLCDKHYQQFKTHGKFLDNSPVCVFDPNAYHIYEETKTVLVDCYDQYGNITRQFLCDLDDLDLVKSRKWRIVHKRDGDYVVTGNQHSEKMYFHRALLKDMGAYEGDHINRDTLDNRKCNLRKASSTVQKLNQKLKSHNTTGFRGVCNRACDSMYGVDFQIKKKRIYMPKFEKLACAVYCRFLLEMYYYPEYRNTDNDDNIAKQIAMLSQMDKSYVEEIVYERIRDFDQANPNIKNIINTSTNEEVMSNV